MSVTENIGAALMLVTFTIVIIALGSHNYFGNESLMQKNALYRQKYDSTDNTISSLLVLTEPNTGMQFNKILGSFFYEKSNRIDTPYGEIEVNKTLEPMLDRFLGKGKYYFEAYPVITDIKMYFVIDGSPTMNPMREFIKGELPPFLDGLRNEGYRVIAKIYILTDDVSLCTDFPAEISCKTLTNHDLYESIEGLGDPYGYAMLTVSPTIYSESDWAAGIAVASNLNNYYSPSKLEMIIPIADEVNLGSKSDSCFTLPNDNRDQSLSRIKCFFCNPKSDYTESWHTVKRIKGILRKNKQLVSPMNALRARYVEADRTFNYLEEYFGRTPDDSKPSTFCGDSQCEACIDLVNCNNYAVCAAGNCPGCGSESGDTAFWHPEAYDELNDQFFYLANMTGGRNFTINQFDEIYQYIQQTIDNYISEMRLKMGKERTGDYLAFQKIIPNPLSNDAFMELKIKYYEDVQFDTQSLEYDVAPVITKFDITTGEDYFFNCTLKDDDKIVKTILSLQGEADSHEIPLDMNSSWQDGKENFFVFDGWFSNSELVSSKYNLSLQVIDENGRIYEIARFYTNFAGNGVCGCDISSSCQYSCECDPDCADIPPQFFWNNFGGTSWNSDDGINYLSPARDQGSCGSCWAFAITGTMEGTYNIDHSLPGFNIDLSEQDLVSCASPRFSGLDGCNGAIPTLGGLNNAEHYTVSPGVQDENEYPYTMGDTACVSGSPSYQAGSWSYVPSVSATEIQRYLVNHGPMLTVLHMDPTTGGWMARKDGTCPITGAPDHAVVIVGYDAEGWIIRNSWGPINSANHHNGYFKVRWGQCAINKNFYPDYPENVKNI